MANPLYFDPDRFAPHVPSVDEILTKKLKEQESALPPLSDQDAESMLQKVSNAGLGALHYVGSTIDKTFGGRAIRGVLGGKPHELLSLLPGSDTVGLTNEADSVSGRQLLENSGLLDKKAPDSGFELSDLAGPALELALDPSTYLTLGTSGSLTAAGKAAEAAGTLAKTAGARIRQGQAGLASVGLPFTAGAPVMTGETGARVADFVGRQADKLIYSGPGRTVSRLFDPAVQGMTGKVVQQTLRDRAGLQEAGQVAQKNEFMRVGNPLEAAGIDLNDRATNRLFRQVLEGVAPAGAAIHPAMQEAADAMRARLGGALGEAESVGRNLPQLADEMPFFPRQFTQQTRGKPTGPGARRAFNPASPHQLEREDFLKGIAGGTEGINDMVADPELARLLESSASGADAAQHIRERYLGMTPQDLQRRDDLVSRARTQRLSRMSKADQEELAALNARFGQADELRGWVAGLDPSHREAGGAFLNSPLTDYATYLSRHARAQEGTAAIHDLLARGASAVADGAAVPEGTMPLADALRRAGLAGGSEAAVAGGQNSILAQLVEKGVLPPSATAEDLARIRVAGDVAGDAERLVRPMQTPEALNPIIQAFDSITNLTKTFQTSLFPGFHTRNMLTGLWQNAVGGARDTRFAPLNPLSWFRPYADAVAMRGGGPVEGAAAIYARTHPGITDEAATRLIKEEMFAHNARVGLNGTQAADAIGLGTLERPAPLRMPGGAPEASVGEVLNPMNTVRDLREGGASVKDMVNPLNMRGVGIGNGELNGALRDTSTNALGAYGQSVGHLGDDLNRMSAYVAFRRQGMEPAVAAAKAKALHYDYGHLTDFEREVMKRVIPFYSWTRQNLPFQLEQLASRPGGLTASAIKATDDMRATQGFIPDYISEGAAVPVGGRKEDGTQRFLTHLGLPFEDAFPMLGTGGKPVQRSLEKAAGMLNPMIKGPLEYLAGKQFYTGRQLDDLYSVTGSDLAEQTLMNSPAARVVTLGRQMADPRKDAMDKLLALTGPAKFNDVDVNKQKAVAGRDVIEEVLKGKPGVRSFENLYVKPEDLAQLSPAELELYQLYRHLESDKQKQGKANQQKVK